MSNNELVVAGAAIVFCLLVPIFWRPRKARK